MKTPDYKMEAGELLKDILRWEKVIPEIPIVTYINRELQSIYLQGAIDALERTKENLK